MEKTYLQLLHMIKASLYKNNVDFEEDEDIDWNEIVDLAKIHNIVPLIYESSSKSEVFKQLDLNFINSWKYNTIHIVYSQIQRTDRFLQLYKKFSLSKVKILVFKGIVLRELYPNPDERISGDEDLLIEMKDLKKTISILEEENFERMLSEEEDVDVYHYICNKTGLHIELHTSLFGKNLKTYSDLNNVFRDIFDYSEKVNINGVDIQTFSLDKHFLYVIIHAIKHFVSCGTGIRQICDIVMYINKYYRQINWNYIWSEVTNLGYDTLFVNFLQIGIDYLGLEESKIIYIKNKNNYYINTENLIEDIMDGGIYGASYQARLNASNMSLDALNKESNSTSKVKSNLAAIFPKSENLKDRYKYLCKYPFLLPVAWASRIYTYIKERGSLTSVGVTAKETIAVGNKRIDLLKEYKLIQ